MKTRMKVCTFKLHPKTIRAARRRAGEEGEKFSAYVRGLIFRDLLSASISPAVMGPPVSRLKSRRGKL
jgi:hypothetical protein